MSARDALSGYAQVAAIALPVALITLAYVIWDDVTRPTPPAGPAQAPLVMTAATTRPSAPVAEVFRGIYADAGWGVNEAGQPSSGLGSTLESTVVYRAFLQAFMQQHGIHSVVDAGCGDWEFSQAMDWRGVDYKGYDVVAAMIASDKAKYAAPNIKFFVADVLEEDLPPADLLISKHVLQHLTNADVSKLIGQFHKYKHVLLTDGVDPRTLSATNDDISRGQYRPLDPTRPPFSVRGTKALTWWDGYDMHQVVHITRP